MLLRKRNSLVQLYASDLCKNLNSFSGLLRYKLFYIARGIRLAQRKHFSFKSINYLSIIIQITMELNIKIDSRFKLAESTVTHIQP